jgi:hypothetical protein
MSKLTTLEFCGTITFHSVVYHVWLAPDDRRVWTSNSKDPSTGVSNYGNAKANSKEQALSVATEMVELMGN